MTSESHRPTFRIIQGYPRSSFPFHQGFCDPCQLNFVVTSGYSTWDSFPGLQAQASDPMARSARALSRRKLVAADNTHRLGCEDEEKGWWGEVRGGGGSRGKTNVGLHLKVEWKWEERGNAEGGRQRRRGRNRESVREEHLVFSTWLFSPLELLLRDEDLTENFPLATLNETFYLGIELSEILFHLQASWQSNLQLR